MIGLNTIYLHVKYIIPRGLNMQNIRQQVYNEISKTVQWPITRQLPTPIDMENRDE